MKKDKNQTLFQKYLPPSFVMSEGLVTKALGEGIDGPYYNAVVTQRRWGGSTPHLLSGQPREFGG